MYGGLKVDSTACSYYDLEQVIIFSDILARGRNDQICNCSLIQWTGGMVRDLEAAWLKD